MARIKVEGISEEEVERKVREHEKRGWFPIGKGISEHPDRFRSHKAAKFLCMMEKDLKDAERHKELRSRLKLTQQQVADRTFSSLQSIVRYEKGHAIPSEEHFKRLEALDREHELILSEQAEALRIERENWSDFVRTAIFTSKLTEEEFAKALGMSHRNIQHWRNGTHAPKKRQRTFIAKRINRIVGGE